MEQAKAWGRESMAMGPILPRVGNCQRDVYYAASQYLNVFGGTHILDYFTAEEIRERILYYMRGVANGQAPGKP